jgi:hypothetical protein
VREQLRAVVSIWKGRAKADAAEEPRHRLLHCAKIAAKGKPWVRKLNQVFVCSDELEAQGKPPLVGPKRRPPSASSTTIAPTPSASTVFVFSVTIIIAVVIVIIIIRAVQLELAHHQRVPWVERHAALGSVMGLQYSSHLSRDVVDLAVVGCCVLAARLSLLMLLPPPPRQRVVQPLALIVVDGEQRVELPVQRSVAADIADVKGVGQAPPAFF